ncbi:MAG: ABC transporter family substrate-binding protein, partial [Bifidobacterium mongoliense]|nr:ABC transporter family substrate-binding protein [Bifidobacterium mongoliense]
MKTRKSGVLAAVSAAAAVAMLLSACGGSSSESKTKVDYVEPSSGIPSSYKGELPTPSATKGYYNQQSRDNVKDGGTLNLAISEIGPNWNYLSTDGNTGYMSSLWQ